MNETKLEKITIVGGGISAIVGSIGFVLMGLVLWGGL